MQSKDRASADPTGHHQDGNAGPENKGKPGFANQDVNLN
jgi:hypothetical protein